MNYFPDLPWEIGDEFENETTGVVYRYDGTKWVATQDSDPLIEYLPLTGGTLTGNLNVGGQLKVTEGNEFKVEYDDGTNMVRVRPENNSIALRTGVINTKDSLGSLSDRAGLEIQVSGEKPLAISNSGSYQSTLEIYGYDGESPDARKRNLFITAGGNINLEGNINAQSFVKGSELRSTKLTSGQSSNLEIYRGSGENEQRKMLIGSDSVNFDVDIKLVSSSKKDIQVQNGTKLFTGGDEIITFGGSGAFYRGTISQDDHIVNRGYVTGAITDAIADIDIPDPPDLSGYLPLTGGELTGQLTIKKNSQVALDIVGDNNTSQIKFWSSGAVALQNYTAFKDNELVTKQYVDGAVAAGGGSSFTPGETVAKTGSAGVEVGGFYITSGNLYVKVS